MTNLTFILGIIASFATIASGIIAIVRFLGRSRVIEELADRLGVDLATLVLPEGGDNEGWATMLDESVPPMQLMRTVQLMAESEEYRLEPSDLVAAGGNVAPPSVLIENALLGEDVDRVRLLGDHLSDEELEELIEERELWPDPIRTVAQLRDDRSHAYAWILSDEATEEDRASLAKEIEETFVQMNQSEPDALHFIVRGIDELKELDSETVESYVKPWLKDSSNPSEENR
jgi:hypothetical protein